MTARELVRVATSLVPAVRHLALEVRSVFDDVRTNVPSLANEARDALRGQLPKSASLSDEATPWVGWVMAATAGGAVLVAVVPSLRRRALGWGERAWKGVRSRVEMWRGDSDAEPAPTNESSEEELHVVDRAQMARDRQHEERREARNEARRQARAARRAQRLVPAH